MRDQDKRRVRMESTGTTRRRFVSRFWAALGLAGVASTGLEAQSASEARWQGAHHPEDEWYDKIPGVHRFVFDTVSPDGLASALGFASTFLITSSTKYGL